MEVWTCLKRLRIRSSNCPLEYIFIKHDLLVSQLTINFQRRHFAMDLLKTKRIIF
jgi:hypothetical protein